MISIEQRDEGERGQGESPPGQPAAAPARVAGWGGVCVGADMVASAGLRVSVSVSRSHFEATDFWPPTHPVIHPLTLTLAP